MYIWIGCKLPEAFAEQLRSCFWKRSEGLTLDTSGFSLPQHISLKISFEAGEKWQEILDFVDGMLRRVEPITVSPAGIGQQGNILWVAFRENGQLRRLHDLLDRELQKRYGIGQHLFDKTFLFHSTLCLGEEEAVRVMRERLADHPLPKELELDTFLLGISESGKSGTYQVIRQIKVKE